MESKENRSETSVPEQSFGTSGDRKSLSTSRNLLPVETAIAKGNNLRGSARKARLVLDLIRGKNVNDAKQILIFSNKRVSLKVEKILNSAIANLTEKEGKADLDRYIVSKAFADDGPIMRRYMPRAQGRATIVRKRTCHITLALAPDETPGRSGKTKNTKAKSSIEAHASTKSKSAGRKKAVADTGNQVPDAKIDKEL